MKESVLRDKSFVFAIRIVKLSQHLQNVKKEFELAKQVLRSGTSIGTLIREAAYGQSRPDFINKMSVAIKEAHETEYWLDLLNETNYLESKLYQSLKADCKELLAMLTATIKTSKAK